MARLPIASHCRGCSRCACRQLQVELQPAGLTQKPASQPARRARFTDGTRTRACKAYKCKTRGATPPRRGQRAVATCTAVLTVGMVCLVSATQLACAHAHPTASANVTAVHPPAPPSGDAYAAPQPAPGLEGGGSYSRALTHTTVTPSTSYTGNMWRVSTTLDPSAQPTTVTSLDRSDAVAMGRRHLWFVAPSTTATVSVPSVSSGSEYITWMVDTAALDGTLVVKMTAFASSYSWNTVYIAGVKSGASSSTTLAFRNSDTLGTIGTFTSPVRISWNRYTSTSGSFSLTATASSHPVTTSLPQLWSGPVLPGVRASALQDFRTIHLLPHTAGASNAPNPTVISAHPSYEYAFQGSAGGTTYPAGRHMTWRFNAHISTIVRVRIMRLDLESAGDSIQLDAVDQGGVKLLLRGGESVSSSWLPEYEFVVKGVLDVTVKTAVHSGADIPGGWDIRVWRPADQSQDQKDRRGRTLRVLSLDEGRGTSSLPSSLASHTLKDVGLQTGHIVVPP